MKPDYPIVRDDGFTGGLFNGNKRTGELYLSVFKAGDEVDRSGPIPLEEITPDLMQFLPPGWTKEGAN